MAPTSKSNSNLLRFALLFVAAYALSQIGLRFFFPQKPVETGVFFRSVSESVKRGGNPEVHIDNRTSSALQIASRCPAAPVDVFFIENVGSGNETRTPLTSTGTTIPCEEIPVIPADESAIISLAPWKYSLFEKNGIYELQLPARRVTVTAQENTGSGALQQGTGAVIPSTLTARFEMREPGPFIQAFRTFITKPLLNLLVFIAGLLPGHSLGIAIIILTIIVKLILFIPTQKSLEGQKKMQILQPKIEALKKQYPNDPKRQQEETMKLWKEHNINPFSACLPTLLQFPILIGLFYAIQEGAHIELSRHLLYSFHQNLPWHFDTSFLGLNLLKPEWYILPVTLAVMQFIQMKLAFAIAKRKSDAGKAVIDVSKDKPKEPMSPQELQQKIMLYALPLLIGVFAFQFPAAVALYWGVSTLFGIGQQLIVNREHLKV